MLIVVIMGRWSDDGACRVVHDVRLYNVFDSVLISGEDVYCNVAPGTPVSVSVFSGMWSELLMTSAISVCVCGVLHAVLYVRVSCFVVWVCAVSRRYINGCNSVVNMLICL